MKEKATFHRCFRIVLFQPIRVGFACSSIPSTCRTQPLNGNRQRITSVLLFLPAKNKSRCKEKGDFPSRKSVVAKAAPFVECHWETSRHVLTDVMTAFG